MEIEWWAYGLIIGWDNSWNWLIELKGSNDRRENRLNTVINE